MKTDRFVALLPMKGHSERVPNKNLRSFGGRPLYHQVMLTLRACPRIEKIVIDTDSENIKRDALAAFPGVQVLDRPEAMRGDMVPMNEIIKHDLSQTAGELFLQTHSTNPLLTAASLDAALDAFLADRAFDSLFSVTRHQARFYAADGRAINHDPRELLRTQDLPPLFEENSCFYVFSRTAFAAQSRRIGLKPRMFEISRIEGTDIDEEVDFQLAEALWRQLRSPAAATPSKP